MLASAHFPGQRPSALLNGWWDFYPVPHPDLSVPLAPREVPLTGWIDKAYLVPGFFTDHPYPAAWREGPGGALARSGWARTRFTDAPQPDQRLYLTIGAAIPQAQVFVNGQRVGVQDDMFLGEPFDITPYVQVGENELAVFLTEFPTFRHPETGALNLVDVPWGCCIAQEQAGIWQDVTLERRPSVHLCDVTVRTSVREETLTVLTQISNVGDAPFAGTLHSAVLDEGLQALALPALDVTLAPGESHTWTQTVRWQKARLWSPQDPHLYHLRSELTRAPSVIVDAVDTRFGFREVWIQGHRILLNGKPQRWRGEWCHKSHSHWLRPEYVRQWFQQLRDLNMNYVRMHTFPHPGYFLDIADEMGILICEESALHGSGQSALDTPNLWPRAQEHVRRMVRRDKNHPALVVWSVENEMRWALNIMPQAKEELPKLRALFNALDPTRPAYHEGDSAIWNEDEQAIISRHYGPACHGLGWWDKKSPLHAGEMGRWHYASPHVALQWAGDEVYTDYAVLSRSLGQDAARIIELGRANEVSCLFVWNTSGLDNLRPAAERVFAWDEPCTPCAKPLAHRAYESEYAWWEDGPGYRPGPSFELLRHAFRPLAIVVREERNQFYTDRLIPHTVQVVNDLPDDVTGTLRVTLRQGRRILWQQMEPLTVASGCTGTLTLKAAPDKGHTGPAVMTTTFRCREGSDEVRRPIRLTVRSERETDLGLPMVGLWGETATHQSWTLLWLFQHSVQPLRLTLEDPLDPHLTPLLVVGEGVIPPGSDANQRLREFLLAGGRALVLEQNHSPFPGLGIQRQPVEMAYPCDADHPVLTGITRDDLRFFGDDPFGVPSSDSWATLYPYVKPTDNQVVRPIVNSSGGDFATGGLAWAPLIEAHIGAGMLIATQLRLADRLDDLPVADRLLSNALIYLASAAPLPPRDLGVDAVMAAQLHSAPLLPAVSVAEIADAPRPELPVTLLSGRTPPAQDPAAWAAYVAAGNIALVWDLDEAARPYWERVIGQPIELGAPEHDVYHLVRGGESALLAGISHEDTCWLENWTYRNNPRQERIVERLLRVKDANVALRSAPRSGLDVLYGDGNATEWKRMPALSAYFDGPLPRTGGALVEVSLGEGWVVFCQVRWQPALWQFRRFLSLLLWNLGLPVATDILAGACTPTAGRLSDGFPQQVRVARGLGAAPLDELLALSKRRVEYCSDNMTFRRWAGWQLVQTPGGRLQGADIAGQGNVVLGLEVSSPEPRKFVPLTIGGWPNPFVQTHLRLEGEGRVQVWVNGVGRASQELLAGKATYVADIDLEAGANFVVLAWEPAHAEGSLALRFENRDHQPEITLAFP